MKDGLKDGGPVAPDGDRAERGSRVLSIDEWLRIAKELALSEREAQIVRLVFDDEKEWTIARELGISSHTVHTYLGRLYRKLSINSRSGLIVRVFEKYRTFGLPAATKSDP